MKAAASFSLDVGAKRALRSLMVCPLKHGNPVSNIKVTKETIAS